MLDLVGNREEGFLMILRVSHRVMTTKAVSVVHSYRHSYSSVILPKMILLKLTTNHKDCCNVALKIVYFTSIKLYR